MAVALLVHLPIRLATVLSQRDSVGFKATRQVLVGIANDLYIACLLGLWVLLGLAALRASRAPRLVRPIGRALLASATPVFAAVTLLVGANFVSVAMTGRNISLYDLGYVNVRDVPDLLDSVGGYLRSNDGPRALGGAALLGASMLLFGLCTRRVRRSVAALSGTSAALASRRLLGMLAMLVVVAVCLRSYTLCFRYVLYEPVETHPVTYLAWRLDKDDYYAIKKPLVGLRNLGRYYASIAAQARGTGGRPLLTFRRFHAEMPPATAPVLPKATNVVLILLESFGAQHLADKPASATFLPSFLDQGWRLHHHYTNVFRTIGAQFSTLCSQQNPPRFFVSREFPQTSLRCLPSILGANGYSTVWVTGTSRVGDYDEEWLAANGFQTLVAEDNFPATTPHTSYGVHDGPVFERLLSEIDKAKKPTFAYTSTVSTHHPYELPEGFVAAHPEIAGWTAQQKAFFYSDLELHRFIDAAKTRPWYKDTLFVVFGDHPPWTFSGGREDDPADFLRTRRRYQTIAGFVHPMLHPLAITHDTTHMALAPTILALLGIDAESELMGSNVFARQPFGTVLSQENSRDSYYVAHDADRVVFRETLTDDCTQIKATSPHLKVPCDAAATSVTRTLKETFYDTVQWQVLSLQRRL